MNIKHNKTDVIAGGETLFREKGYHNTGIKEILDHCEIPKGSFYNFFPSKEAFTRDVIVYYGNRLLEFIRAYVQDTTKSPLERLRALYYALIEYAKAEQCSKGCLVYNLAYELGGLNKDLAQTLDTQFDNWISLITDCIREGQESGEIRTDKDAGEMASVLHTAFNGSYGRVKMKRDTAPMRLMVDTLLDFMKA